MIRAVVDTNVRFSAILTDNGTAAKCLYLLKESHRVLVSLFLLNEFASTVRRKLGYTEQEIAHLLDVAQAESELLAPQTTIHSICRDPDDDHVLECALSGRADFIISGDNDLLSLVTFQGIRIVTPSQFLKLLDAQSPGLSRESS